MKINREDCPNFRRMGQCTKVFAIDLDNTLFCFIGLDKIGPPMPSILTRMNQLRDMGCRIIIHTSRISPPYHQQRQHQISLIESALRSYGVPFDEIWTGEGKPIACGYVDDKAYHSLGELIQKLEWEGGTEPVG